MAVNSSFGELLGNNRSSVPEFDGLIPCYRWYLKNQTASYEQAHQACAVNNFIGMAPGIDIIFWLTGIFTIVSNLTVLLAIIGTQERSKPICFFLANLAMSDLLSGIALLYRTEGRALHSAKYSFMMTFVDSVSFTQMLSASALSILSVNSWLAVSHPMFFRAHALNIKRMSYFALSMSWVVFPFLAFAPSMGWNCLDMKTLITAKCVKYYPIAYFIMFTSVILILCTLMLFTNIVMYVKLRKDASQNNVDQDTRRKFEKSAENAKTVMLHVAVALSFWLLAIMIIPICNVYRDTCPRMNVVVAVVCLNSAINPIATLLRTPALKKTLGKKLNSIYRVFVQGNVQGMQGKTAGIDTHIQGDATELQRISHISEEQPAVTTANYDCTALDLLGKADPEQGSSERNDETCL
ncbi:Gamma-tubulin complex component 5 [Branchiostoma belcheri]|nr:Gamma-tubulin complex component 5 [Branchiostoma belcheri]